MSMKAQIGKNLLVLTITGALLMSTSPASAGVSVGDRAAAFSSVKDGAGKAVTLKPFRGKWLVLTFGASWCKPCKKELPAWEKLARAYRAKKANIQFIAVNIDKNSAKGKTFMKRAGLKAMLAAFDSSGATVDAFRPPTMPTTYVIGPRGLVRHIHKGYKAGAETDLSSTLDGLIK